MAAPNNLSLHSSFSSSQQQHSLQTPDTSALFSSSPLPSRDTTISSHFNEDVSSLNSLEDLLSFSGITSADSSNGPVKRHFDDDVEFPDSKRLKREAQTSSTTSVIPSILPTSKFHQPISSPVNGGLVLPLVKPFSTPASSINSTGNIPFPVLTQTSLTSHSAAIDSNASSNSQVNAGSVALLVQLYKHFQSSGDSNGMAKVHQQLLALHSQLASKAGAYLNSLTGSSTTNQFIGSSNPVSVSASNGTTTSSNVLSSSDYTNKMSSSGMSGINSGQFSTGFTSSQLHNKSLLGSLPSLPSSSSSITTLPLPSQSSATGLNPLHIHVPTTTAVSQPLPHHSLSLSTATASLFSPSLSTIASIPRSLTNDLTLPTGTLGLSVPNQVNHVVTQAPLKLSVSQAQSKLQAGSVESTVKTSTPFSMPLSTTSTINSPSIVTHSLSNSTSSSNNLPSLTGLQVTAQTQANVLRAVYSYRIQRIQEFLNSLPPDQRPTTTNELKDLLIKNNILAKALPPDMIANLQQQVASAASSTAATVTATVNGMPVATTTISPSLVTATTNTQSIINPVATPNISALSSISVGSTPISHTPPLGLAALAGGGIGGQTSVGLAATVSKQTSAGGQSTLSVATSSTGTITSSIGSAPTGPLPGVTLETLRTLCRLPEADLVRIPMPPMLLTVVQYMRANKWSGSSFDLPNLIQQAQDGLAKGKITTASPQPPFQTSPAYSSGVKATSTSQQLKQPQSSTSALQQQKTNNSSPLSQYMASVGMKMPPTTIANSSQTNKSPLTVAKPSLPQNSNSRNFPNKTAQENIEKERISALQKVLQSSEEARIAFRFQAHLDKLHQQISSPELERPFSTWQDLILRLLPYHVYREPELPSGAMEKADAVYEGIAGVLLSRSQGLMNQFQQILLREEQRQNNDDSASIVLRRLWLEGEKERKEEEERQKREAEQIAAELSAVGSGTSASSFLDSDPFMLDSDPYNDYPFLDQFWGEASDGLGSLNEFNLGIT